MEGAADVEVAMAAKGRGKNARQFTWVMFLRAHRAAGCVAWAVTALMSLPSSIKKRLATNQDDSLPAAEKGRGGGDGEGGILFEMIRGLLMLSAATLGFELLAHWRGWHLGGDADGAVHAAYVLWLQFRAKHIARSLQLMVSTSVTLFFVQTADRLVQFIGFLWIKLRGIKPTADGDPFGAGEDAYPTVLVQIPMCNEKEVYEQSISAACRLEWPRERMLIQVLDDSDDVSIAAMIEAEVAKWSERGSSVVYRRRLVRSGYKAGNLKSGMSCDYAKGYEFVAIFDADFQPSPDFLKRTIPHFKDPAIGLVQARWSFVNKEENLLTRLQYINMSYHFEVEQQVNGAFLGFFGFNGTAGVWRVAALEDSGGWMERTTVEDMDIAVRAHLNGWRFVFLNDVRVPCEVPESYEAYRKQQHRWHSGPMNLFRHCFPDIVASKISPWKKANLIALFFALRKVVLPSYTFALSCVVLPLAMFVPEAELPLWLICHAPLVLSLLTALPAPRYFPLAVPYMLFENTMSATKFDAALSGILQLGSSYEWVVTKKAGRSPEQRGADAARQPAPAQGASGKKANKIYKKELMLGLLLLTAAARSVLSGRRIPFYVLLFQGAAFLLVGLDLIGEQVS